MLSIPSAPESVSCVRTWSPPLPASARTLIKGQHRPGCNRKQIQPESPSSRNMLSRGKRLTFQKHELCKKKKEENSDRGEAALEVLLLPCAHKGGEEGECALCKEDFIQLSKCTQSTCILLLSGSIVGEEMRMESDNACNRIVEL